MNCNNMGFQGNGCNDGLRHIEQIALNKGSIDCLSGRVERNETDIRERYTKSEVDRMLEGKLDRCAFEKYVIKCEDSGSCDCGNIPGPCDCDCYSKDEVDSLLENKANKELEWHDLQMRSGYEMNVAPKYTKDAMGFVHMMGYANKQGAPIPWDESFADLPIGFRPLDDNYIPVALKRTTSGISYGEAGAIRITDGAIQLCNNFHLSSFTGGGVSFNGVTFYAGI